MKQKQSLPRTHHKKPVPEAVLKTVLMLRGKDQIRKHLLLVLDDLSSEVRFGSWENDSFAMIEQTGDMTGGLIFSLKVSPKPEPLAGETKQF
jgi:hypothetical protein